MKYLKIEKSLTNPKENVVLTIVNRRPGATLLNCDEEHSIEVCIADLFVLPEMPAGYVVADEQDILKAEEKAGFEIVVTDDLDPAEVKLGTIQGL